MVLDIEKGLLFKWIKFNETQIETIYNACAWW